MIKLLSELLTILCIDLSHLHQHEFRHCFQNTFKIFWILYANMTKTLNQLCISFSTAPTLSVLDKPSLTKLGTWMITFSLKWNETNSNSSAGNQNYHSRINRHITNSTTKYFDWKIQMLAFWLFCKKGCVLNSL